MLRDLMWESLSIRNEKSQGGQGLYFHKGALCPQVFYSLLQNEGVGIDKVPDKTGILGVSGRFLFK